MEKDSNKRVKSNGRRKRKRTSDRQTDSHSSSSHSRKRDKLSKSVRKRKRQKREELRSRHSETRSDDYGYKEDYRARRFYLGPTKNKKRGIRKDQYDWVDSSVIQDEVKRRNEAERAESERAEAKITRAGTTSFGATSFGANSTGANSTGANSAGEFEPVRAESDQEGTPIANFGDFWSPQ